MIKKVKECIGWRKSSVGEMEGEFKIKHRGSISEDRSIPVGWVGISSHWLKYKVGEEKYKDIRREIYGTWWRIDGPEGSIYRVFRMSPQLKGSNNDQNTQMALDWGGRIGLLGEPNENDVAELTLRPIKCREYLYCIFNYPDPAYILARLPALVSIFLGILSVILALCLKG